MHGSSQPQDLAASICSWLLEQGLAGTPFDTLLETLCQKLVDAGIPLYRSNVSMRAMHPEVGAFAYRWKRTTGMQHEEYVRDTTVFTGWEHSPLKYLIESPDIEDLHMGLTDADRPFRFPMFEEIAAQGATDYFAQKLAFTNITAEELADPTIIPFGLLLSWSADGPGFSDADVAVLRQILPSLGLALKSNSNYQTADDLLSTYLGKDAARRVMSGDIIRGSTQGIDAVILMFDLSGFTKLSETLPGKDVVALLNSYYAMVVETIEARGGNVLKFMGDGLLAVFTDEAEDKAGAAAIETVKALRAGMDAINQDREAENLVTTGCTIAVHAGQVHYGNIGGTSRLDFTVIGSAVNTTARLSGMCSHVDQPVVISDRVARPHLKNCPDLVSLGIYRMRGVKDRVELFTLD